MMKTYFLKFDDEQQAVDALAAYRTESGWLQASHDHALDVVGVIVKPGTYDEKDTLIEAPVILPGWHVNLAVPGDLPEELGPYQVFPSLPARVFA